MERYTTRNVPSHVLRNRQPFTTSGALETKPYLEWGYLPQ